MFGSGISSILVDRSLFRGAPWYRRWTNPDFYGRGLTCGNYISDCMPRTRLECSTGGHAAGDSSMIAALSSLAMSGSMGICMRLYLAPEADLRTFAVAPVTLKAWLQYPRSSRDVSLHEYWRGLDAILTSIPATQARSWLTPEGADYVYPGAADHGAHSLSSGSTEALLRTIDQVTTAQVAAYVRQQWGAETSTAGRSPDLTPAQLSDAVEELELYFAPLRETCARAVDKGYGLVMALWDASHGTTRTSSGVPEMRS